MNTVNKIFQSKASTVLKHYEHRIGEVISNGDYSYLFDAFLVLFQMNIETDDIFMNCIFHL